MAVHPLGPTKFFTTIWSPGCPACAAVPAQITAAASGSTTRLDMILSFVRGIGPVGVLAGRAGTISGGGARLGRVVADDHGGDDRGDLVAGHADAPGVLADRFGVPSLVDAEGPDPAAGLLDHVAPDPADAVAHLLVADLGRLGAGGFEFLQARPGVGAANDVEVHDFPQP